MSDSSRLSQNAANDSADRQANENQDQIDGREEEFLPAYLESIGTEAQPPGYVEAVAESVIRGIDALTAADPHRQGGDIHGQASALLQRLSVLRQVMLDAVTTLTPEEAERFYQETHLSFSDSEDEEQEEDDGEKPGQELENNCRSNSNSEQDIDSRRRCGSCSESGSESRIKPKTRSGPHVMQA